MLLRAPFEHVRSKGIWSLRDVTLDQEKIDDDDEEKEEEDDGEQATQHGSAGVKWHAFFHPRPLPLPRNRVRRPKRAAGLPPCAVLVGFLSVHVGFFPSLDVGNLVFVKMS